MCDGLHARTYLSGVPGGRRGFHLPRRGRTVEYLAIVLCLFGGGILLLDAFSLALQRVSVPGPLAALILGIVLGPYVLNIVTLEAFGLAPAILLEEVSQITLAISLTGVALRLPHGYWRRNWRWLVAMIGLGMALMWAIAAGLIWVLLDVPLLVALIIGATMTPTDPVVSTPIVTGEIAESQIPARVRHNISSESGVNDGLAHLFVLLPVLLLTKSDRAAWTEWLTRGLMHEIFGACVLGGIAGYLMAKLFVLVTSRGMMEETAYSGFIIALALFLLGIFRLTEVNDILGVFVASAVFGQCISQRDEEEEDRESEIIGRFFIIPIFILTGVALPFGMWADLGIWVPVVLLFALLLRRIVTVWLLRPLFRPLHSTEETWFLSWFAAVGVSALYYSLVVERETGRTDIFPYATLAITLSLVIHGLTSTPFGAWLHRLGKTT